jgi:hypothetical protein
MHDPTTTTGTRSQHRGEGAPDAGQALPFAALGVALTVGVLIVLGQVGGLLASSAAARTAADAAALAGAAQGEAAARSIAIANGAELVSYEDHGGTAEVTVRVGRAEATARAERSVELEPPSRP